MRFDSAEKVWT